MVGQHLQPDRAVLACRVADDAVERTPLVPALRLRGRRPRDTVTRRLAHEPLGCGRPRCCCSRSAGTAAPAAGMWRQDTSRAAEPQAKLTRTALRWALVGLVRQHLSVARLAEALAVVDRQQRCLAEGRRVLLDDPAPFDSVQVIGVDEHVWRHTRRGDRFVTVVIDLTPVRTGPARRGCWRWSRAAPAGVPSLARRAPPGLAGRPGGGRDGRSPATRPPPATSCPRRRRFRLPTSSGSPATLWTAAGVGSSRTCAQPPRPQHRPALPRPRTLHTGADLLTDRQQQRLTALFADEDHIQVQATWSIYQRMIAAYRHPDRAAGRRHDPPDHRAQCRRPGRPHRTPHPRPDPEEASHRHPGLLRPPPAPATAQPRP